MRAVKGPASGRLTLRNGLGAGSIEETAPGEYLYRDGARYCPFATTLQIVFYRNRKGLVLVKFLANEEETLIPELKAYSGPYYRWDDVKEYVNDK